jgi:hypothetical protein
MNLFQGTYESIMESFEESSITFAFGKTTKKATWTNRPIIYFWKP